MELITAVYGIWDSEFLMVVLTAALCVIFLGILMPFQYVIGIFGSIVVVAGIYSVFARFENSTAAEKYRSASERAALRYNVSPVQLEQFLSGCDKVNVDNPEKCYQSDYSEPKLTELQQKNIQSLKNLAMGKMKGRACLHYQGYFGAIICTAAGPGIAYGNIEPRPLSRLLVNGSLAELVANNPTYPSVHYDCKTKWSEKPVYAATRNVYYEVHMAESVSCERLNGGKPMDEATFSRLLLADLDRELPNEVHAGHVRNMN